MIKIGLTKLTGGAWPFAITITQARNRQIRADISGRVQTRMLLIRIISTCILHEQFVNAKQAGFVIMSDLQLKHEGI